jgi:S-(hydroxymethyl)glutathione dehydrogenase/alcohol dehydrogenase
VVIGCGAVGLNAIQAARLAGARTIVAVDLSADHRALAMSFGATHAIDPADDAVATIREATAGRGGDAVFESAGAHDAMRLAFEATRPGGILVLLGKLPFDADLAVRFGSLMGEKRIVRSSSGGARPHRDFPRIVDAVRRGDLQLAPLVTHRVSLDTINEGFEAMARGETVRAVMTL